MSVRCGTVKLRPIQSATAGSAAPAGGARNRGGSRCRGRACPESLLSGAAGRMPSGIGAPGAALLQRDRRRRRWRGSGSEPVSLAAALGLAPAPPITGPARRALRRYSACEPPPLTGGSAPARPSRAAARGGRAAARHRADPARPGPNRGEPSPWSGHPIRRGRRRRDPARRNGRRRPHGSGSASGSPTRSAHRPANSIRRTSPGCRSAIRPPWSSGSHAQSRCAPPSDSRGRTRPTRDNTSQGPDRNSPPAHRPQHRPRLPAEATCATTGRVAFHARQALRGQAGQLRLAGLKRGQRRFTLLKILEADLRRAPAQQQYARQCGPDSKLNHKPSRNAGCEQRAMLPPAQAISSVHEVAILTQRYE